MERINTWNINCNESNYNLIHMIERFPWNCRQLLNLNKDNYTYFEQYIYDISNFHFSRMDIHNIKNYYVEFLCKKETSYNKLHTSCDNVLQTQDPILSCITYLNDSINPTIITNINNENYKFKEFDEQTEIMLSYPKTNKQITFDGSFFHGCTTLTNNQDDIDRYIIVINIWNTKPTQVNYYEPNNYPISDDMKLNKCVIGIQQDNAQFETVNVSDDIINYNFFNNLLYHEKKDSCYIFNNFINNDNNNDSHMYNFKLDKSIKEEETTLKLKNKYGDRLINDMRDITTKDTFSNYNRFLQRFRFSKMYSHHICDYIIEECEKYAKKNDGWTTNRHHNYPTTDIPVNQIPSIFSIIMHTFTTIVNKIKTSYELPDNMNIDIKDLFVVKYEYDKQNSLEMHTDKSFISINILLNDNTEFEGGGTYFNDGLTTFLEKGDLLIHSSQIKHSGLPIVKGTRYLLVGFLNIDLM